MKQLLDWAKENKGLAIVLTAIICGTLITIVSLMQPPRYQKAGGKNHLILDTREGRMLRMDGTPVKTTL